MWKSKRYVQLLDPADKANLRFKLSKRKKLLEIFSSLQNPETGRFDVRYIFVDVDSYPRRTIVIEDNRQPTIKVAASPYGVFNDTGVASLHMNCRVFSIIPLGLSIYAAWGFVTGSNLSGPPLKFITDPAFEDKPMKKQCSHFLGKYL